MSFSQCDDCCAESVLSYLAARELLHLAVLCKALHPVARSDALWAAHYNGARKDYPLGLPGTAHGVPHPAVRLTCAALCRVPCKALKSLAHSVGVDFCSALRCSEKCDIVR
jgi:hypothetical protein